jgi:hypothetical protein
MTQGDTPKHETPGQTDVDEIRIDKLKISDDSALIPPSQPDDSDLIRQLRDLAAKQPKLVRGKKYDVPGQSLKLTSWKMTEYMYTKSPCPFPTLARGLFTRWIPAPGQEKAPEGKKGAGRDQIVVRGYDKFFNMNEVKWNTVSLISSMICIISNDFVVGGPRRTYDVPIYPHSQKQRLHHLHVCTISERNHRHLQALSGGSCGIDNQPRGERRGVARQALGKSRENQSGVCQDAVRSQYHSYCRGDYFPLWVSPHLMHVL